MKKYEKIFIVLVVAWFIGNMVSPLMLNATARAMSSSATAAQKNCANALSVAYGYVQLLPQCLIAIWMFIDAGKKHLNKWIWGIVGFGLGINGAILYVALQILDAIRLKNEDNPPSVPGHPPQGVESYDPRR